MSFFPRHFPVLSPNRHQAATRIEFGANECVSVGRGEFIFFLFFHLVTHSLVALTGRPIGVFLFPGVFFQVVTSLLTKLEATEKSKRKLQQWKIRNQHTMVMLNKQMSTLQRGLNGEEVDHHQAHTAPQTAPHTAHAASSSSSSSFSSSSSVTAAASSSANEEVLAEARQWSEKVLAQRVRRHAGMLYLGPHRLDHCNTLD